MFVFKVGSDIDSTINRAHQFDIIHGRQFCIEHHCVPKHEYLNECEVKKMFSLNDEMYNLYMAEYFKWNCQCNIPELCAPEVLRSLARDFYTCVVTGRDDHYTKSAYKGEDMKRDTLEWFNRYNIPMRDFFFAAKTKVEICKNEGIDILIEDNPEIIVICADAGIPVVIAAQSYNEKLIHYPNTYYARNWIEIEKFVRAYAQLKRSEQI